MIRQLKKVPYFIENWLLFRLEYGGYGSIFRCPFQVKFGPAHKKSVLDPKTGSFLRLVEDLDQIQLDEKKTTINKQKTIEIQNEDNRYADHFLKAFSFSQQCLLIA